MRTPGMVPGGIISFKTKGGTRVFAGSILAYDDYLSLPMRVEYYDFNTGDKRIERFHPAEFEVSYDGH